MDLSSQYLYLAMNLSGWPCAVYKECLLRRPLWRVSSFVPRSYFSYPASSPCDSLPSTSRHRCSRTSPFSVPVLSHPHSPHLARACCLLDSCSCILLVFPISLPHSPFSPLNPSFGLPFPLGSALLLFVAAALSVVRPRKHCSSYW